MNNKEKFLQAFPNAFFLTKEIEAVAAYLHGLDFLAIDEKIVSLEKPGEGNMNFVLRVRTNKRSFIIKQARPWVEKYPQIAAPVERVAVEAQFFQLVQEVDIIKNYTPKCLGFDQKNFLLLTEDLGEGSDYSFLYQKGKVLSLGELNASLKYLSILHQLPLNANFPENRKMRLLNQEHIFYFPYLLDNGLNLDDIQIGLQEAALPYKTDTALKAMIQHCGKIYLSQGKHLLHGDYYPGSWLKAESGLKIIDPEFGFVGPAEFDLSVLLAHLLMAEQSVEHLQYAWQQYEQPKNFNSELLAQLTGIEILRRLIGIAQLPISLDLMEKKELMQRAANWIKKKGLDFI
jgi:5-methylthioribose kinase